MKKILVASSHHITVYGLELLLKSKHPEIVVETVCNYQQVLEVLEVNNDFQLLITILDANTAEMATNLVKNYPQLPMLTITSSIGLPAVQRLYSTGIKGVIDIASSADCILHAISEVMKGQTFMEEKFKNYLLQMHTGVSMSRTPFDILTKREEEVIGLMLKGKKMGEISSYLNLRPSTVSTFKTKIYEKLGVNSLLELKEVCMPQQ